MGEIAKNKEEKKALGYLGLLLFLPLLAAWVVSLMKNCLVPVFTMGLIVVLFTYFCFWVSR